MAVSVSVLLKVVIMLLALVLLSIWLRMRLCLLVGKVRCIIASSRSIGCCCELV